MNLIHNLCARLGHPWRRLMCCDVHLDKTISCTRYYICRVCGEVFPEEGKE